MMFCCNLFIQTSILVPFICYNALGLDEIGVCGPKPENLILKSMIVIEVSFVILAYCISAFCGKAVMKKIRNHSAAVADTFQVSEKKLIKFL